MNKRESAHRVKVLGMFLAFAAMCVFCFMALPEKAKAADKTFTITNLNMKYNQEKVDRKFTSAVWHDIELEFQGGNNYKLIGIWDPANQDIPFTVEEGTKLQFENSNRFVLPAATGLNDPSDIDQLVVWEYEPDSYLSLSGAEINYYERVSLQEGPAVAGFSSDSVTIRNLDKEHPVAILQKLPDAADQSLLQIDEEEFDNYWHYYFTNAYAAKHGDFLLEYYDYEKSQEMIGGQLTNVLTLKSFDNHGVINYPAAAYAIGLDVLADDSVFDERYGKSPMPEGLQKKDYQIKKWSIPEKWKDPYDGVTYQIRFAKNYEHSEYEMTGPYPLYPINAKAVEVSGGVIFPDDCRYLFYEGGGFSIQGQLSPAHSWVGTAGAPLHPGAPEGYHQPTFSLVQSFALNGPKMAGNVKDMSYMFRIMPDSFGAFDISSINTENVTNMSHMFELRISSDESFKGLSSVDTSNVTNMEEMFKIAGPVNLTKEDLQGFHTEKVTNMKGMFADSNIMSVDLSGFSFDLVSDLSNFFYRDFGLGEVIFPANMNTNLVTNMSGMFQGCQSLTEIKNLSALDTGNVTDMSYMFGGYFFRPGRPYANWDYTGPSVSSLDLSNFDTSNVETMASMFKLPKAASLNLSSFNTEKVKFMNEMFELKEIPSLDLSSFKTANVVDMSKMFNLDSATALNLSTFDTSNVTSMSHMFALKKIPELNLANFNTGKVTNMDRMFELGSVEALDVSMLDTSAVTSMYSMFNLPKAKSLTLGGKFTTVNVRDMSYMFTLDSIKEMDVTLDISGNPNLGSLFDLRNATKLKLSLTGDDPKCSGALTINAPSLLTLDLSGSKIQEKWFLNRESFTNCNSLMDLYLPDQLPLAWYETDTPSLPSEFYLAGKDTDEVFTDLSTIVGDLSVYDVVGPDGELIVDPKSSRPIERKEDAILIRVANLIETENVSLKQQKYNPETEQYEYPDIEDITLYRYADGEYPMNNYPNTISIVAMTDPEEVYPQPSLSWQFNETPAKEGQTVLDTSSWTNGYTLNATKGWGTCEIELTATVPSLTGEGEPKEFKDTVHVTVLPMVRAKGISFMNNTLTMLPGETLNNPASITKDETSFPGEDLTFPGATYVSSDPSIVTVNKTTGKLTAKTPGAAVITATTNDPANKKAQCYVVVDDPDREVINWYPLMSGGSLVEDTTDYDNVIAYVGTKGTFKQMAAKKTISYNNSKKVITLEGYQEAGLSLVKENLTIALKGKNQIFGDGSSNEDGLFPERNTLLKAEAGASLSAKIDKSVRAFIKPASNITTKVNKDGTVTYSRAKISIKDAAIASVSAKTYTGSEIKPAPSVKVGTTTLKAGTDYTLSYKNNINAGTATIIVTGKGKYTGTATKQFTIKPAELTSATLKSTSLKYTGKALKPGATVKAKVGGKTKTLSSGKDYTITYKNNINVGTATAVIKGKGNYTGTLTKKFRITKAPNSISAVTPLSKSFKEADLKKGAKSFKLTATDKFGAAKTFALTSSTTSKTKKYVSLTRAGKVTVRQGTPKGTYKLYIKVSAKGTANYGAASTNKTVSIVVK
ncbi:MAG: BspA family leucine-rich repeat surface protein [Parasporobacterium sp.]|nr:BspA family leucine-rich repeat surface protein [Parasporobacterium sp.]